MWCTWSRLFLRGGVRKRKDLEPRKTVAIGVHGDGVPYTKKDSIEILSWNFLALPTMDRIPITAISKQFLCQQLGSHYHVFTT